MQYLRLVTALCLGLSLLAVLGVARVIPVPSSALLLSAGFGLLGLLGWQRKRSGLVGLALMCAALFGVNDSEAAPLTIEIKADVQLINANHPHDIGDYESLFGDSDQLVLSFNFLSGTPLTFLSEILPDGTPHETATYALDNVVASGIGGSVGFVADGDVDIQIQGPDTTPPVFEFDSLQVETSRTTLSRTFFGLETPVFADFGFLFLTHTGSPTGTINGGFPSADLTVFQFLNRVPTPTQQYIDVTYCIPNPFDCGLFSAHLSNFEVVPVPAALPLLLTGLIGLGAIGWRRRKAT